MPDVRWDLYRGMLTCRLFEEAVARLWHDGLISGEMHLGTGEEGIVAGVVPLLRDGDALALDHRGTAPLLVRGVDPVLILRELLGRPDGLCGGQGGHMHLFAREYLAASSGIVGSAGPAAAGFALSAQLQRPGAVAVAFFGEGALNQGMLLESMNLAAVWRLPVLFVCKDDGWSITARSDAMTGGDLSVRARGVGVPAMTVDGVDVLAVREAAEAALARARRGEGPTFLRARCVHLEAHFLGYQLLRATRDPVREMAPIAGPLARNLLRGRGAAVGARLAGLRQVLRAMIETVRDPRADRANDPVQHARRQLSANPGRVHQIEDEVAARIGRLLDRALAQEPATAVRP